MLCIKAIILRGPFTSKQFLDIILSGIIAASIAGCSNAPQKEVTEFLEQKIVNEQTIVADKNFANQNSVVKNLEAELQKKPSFDKPFVVVDPFKISPLTAMVVFVTEEPSTISVKVEGKDKYSTIEHTFKTSCKQHMVPVYGLYANKSNKVTLTSKTKDGKIKTQILDIQTDVLPTDISKTRVKTIKKEKMVKGLTFVDCPHVNDNYMLAVDANGDIRWYLSEKKYNGSVMLTHLRNGNMLISNGAPIPKTYNNLPTVFEISPLGRVYAAYNVSGIHHDIRETKNGNLIMAASLEGRKSQNDNMVEVDRATGKVIRNWDIKEILPMTKYEADKPYGGGDSNWFHNNAVWYDEDKGEFIISGRHQNTVAKFDANTKKLKWIMSKTIGAKNEKVRPYILKETGTAFEYPTAQHAAMKLPNGNIMLFDNTNFDIADKNGELMQDKMYSRAVIYSIDEENMTVKQEWQYGKERGRELYSSFISDVDYLGENHYLIDFGGKYIANNGDVYDHMYTKKEIKNKSNRESKIIEMLNNEIIWEIDLYGNSNSNTYKAERKDIYQGI